jgi:hypothetical protein
MNRRIRLFRNTAIITRNENMHHSRIACISFRWAKRNTWKSEETYQIHGLHSCRIGLMWNLLSFSIKVPQYKTTSMKWPLFDSKMDLYCAVLSMHCDSCQLPIWQLDVRAQLSEGPLEKWWGDFLRGNIFFLYTYRRNFFLTWWLEIFFKWNL